MKIDNVSISNVTRAYQSETPVRANGDAIRQADGTQSGKTDLVELSTRKSEIEKLRKTAESLPDVRSEKVAALKQQITDGTYKVDGVKVAEKMLEHFKGSGGTGGSK